MKRNLFANLMAIIGLICLTSHYAAAQVLTDFINHGVPASVSESRGILAVRDKTGQPFIVAMAHDQYGSGVRCSLLVIDAQTGETQQYWYPVKNQANGDTYCIMRTLDGMIYTGINTTFLEFSLETRQWTFSGQVDGFPMALTRTPSGEIYFGTYSNCSLYGFNPTTRVLEKKGQLDPQQDYPTYTEAGADGWVYSGIGTALANIVAYNPQTGEFRSLMNQADRKTGTSFVFATSSGIYGREYSVTEGRLMKLQDGAATFVEGNPANPPRVPTGAINWGNMLSGFPGGGAIASFSLPDKTAEVIFNGVRKRITFTYESNGAGVTSLTVGPNAKVYGSTNHPMRLFSYDPAQSASGIVDNGGIPQIAGGNIGAFGNNGQYLVGASYSFGTVYEYDTTQPWNSPSATSTINPRAVATFNEVSRPRSSVTLPNGDILFGGYPAYGYTGGGLVTYHAATRDATVKPAEQIVPNQSTVALELVDQQTVVGGTSIETPGGGEVKATVAELYLLDIATQTVTFRTVPVPGARSISALHVGADGKIYGLTNNIRFFVFDPQTKTVIHSADWSGLTTEWNAPLSPGHSLWRIPNGRVGVLLPKFILEVQPDYSYRKLADLTTPATAGGVVLNNRLYFATGSNLQSVGLAQLALKPSLTIKTPLPDQKMLISAFKSGGISGTATDNLGITKVEVTITRLRSGVVQTWNGTAFVTTSARVPTTLTGSATSVNWALNSPFPSSAQLDEGEYIVVAYVTDVEGNVVSATTRLSLFPSDNVKPVTQIFTPTLNQKILLSDFTSGAANIISGNATDNIGIASVRVKFGRKRGTTNTYWNGTAFTTSAFLINATVVPVGGASPKWNLDSQMPPLSQLDSGLYQIEVYAIDVANNKSATVVRPFTLGTDFTAPSAVITAPTQGQATTLNSFTAGTIKGTASDNLGVNSVKIKLIRKRGSTTTYWNGTAFTTTASTVDATVTAVGSTNVSWSLNNVPTPAQGLDTGSYTLYASAYDGAGNTKSSASRSFYLVRSTTSPDSAASSSKS